MTVDQTLRMMREKIRNHGWVITGVGESSNQCSTPGCQHRHGPIVAQDPCLYTAGLTMAGQPELLLQHVPTAAAYPILQALAKWSLNAKLVPGEPVRIEHHGVFTVERVPPVEGRRLCKIARRLYGDGIRVLRISRAD